MEDQFSQGTPWDLGDPVAGDFSTVEPKRKVELSGPIFQGKGQKAVRMKAPKAPKPKRDPDDIFGETIARVIWVIIRTQRTVAVIAFLVAVAAFTYAFATGASGKPIRVTLPVTAAHLLNLPTAPVLLAPALAAAVAFLLAFMVAAIVGLTITRPHGKFNRFTFRAFIFAVVGVIIDPALAVTLTHLLQHGLTTLGHHIPQSFAWVFDPHATPHNGATPPAAPITPTPAATPHSG
ncbi:hypothetical protein [Curtobacterium sp. MCBD17_040]|uniref:hypothetical protein n=1 Tax=Curtobacterium sp. MCBD17_040 TaxID=2175674 RepID=UPI000DA6EB02|nr:hypothetical protein [Curtobacterium sp. MCBD17_040]WIB65335.1 hypothetical protein DEI94_18180 [Curtobacterium sp. MCBD17_040]